MFKSKFFLAIAALLVSSLTQAAVVKEYEAHHLFPYPTPNKELATTPAAPKLVGPSYFAKMNNNATLTWEAVPTATNYHLQVATDPNFKWLVVEQYNLEQTTFQVDSLEAGKHYYWRVLAVKRDNVASWMKSAWAGSMFTTQN